MLSHPVSREGLEFVLLSPNNSICSVCPFSQKAMTGNDQYYSMIQPCSCKFVTYILTS